MSRQTTVEIERARKLTAALGVFLAALCVRVIYLAVKGPLLTADGLYYYAVARNLVRGRGLVSDYVWHYLMGIPARLPVPSNEYWMPLNSLLQAVALKVGAGAVMAAAVMPSIIAGAALAALVFWFAAQVSGDTRAGLLAAAMWTVSAHQVALAASPDCFMVAALLTSLGLYMAGRALQGPGNDSPDEAARRGAAWWAMGGGALAGLAYLTRSDGALLAVVFVMLWLAANRRGSVNWRALAMFGAAFVIIVAPWWWRNWVVFGSPLGAPVGKAAFLTTYNDLFRLDTLTLTLSGYLRSNQVVQGLMRGYVLWREARLLAVMCGLALPFAIWGAVRQRRCAMVRAWLVYLALVLAVTALVFPYPALKGTFWHLAPTVCVFVFAVGAGQIVAAADFLRRRGGRFATASAAALPVVAVAPLVAWYAFTPSADQAQRSAYRAAARELRSLRPAVRAALSDDVWTLHHHTGLRCAQVPTDGAGATLRVADALGANYLLVRERTLRAIAGVAAIRRCRRFEAVARWGAGADAVYAYRIMPFAEAEQIARSHNARGMALAGAGRFDDAIAAFEAAESYKPDFAPIISNIALACWQAGRHQEAYLRAAQALALDPDNRTANRIMQECR